MSLFRVTVYDKNRVFRCQIGDPISLEVNPRHNLVGTLTMRVGLDHPKAGELLADGARIVCEYKGGHLLSGPITEAVIEGPTVNGSLTVTVEDDFRVLSEILGWPSPINPISDQDSREFFTSSGHAEAVVKDLVQRNGVDRLHIPGLVVAPNQDRGAVIPGGVLVRMEALADKLFPAVDAAGIGVSVRQIGTNLVLDVYEPSTYPRPLTEAGRTIKSFKWTRTRPVLTRQVVGGAGEGRDRYFRTVVDGVMESRFNAVAEGFTDAAATGSDYEALVKDTAKALEDRDKKGEAKAKAQEAYDQALVDRDLAEVAVANAQGGTASNLTKAQNTYTSAGNKVASTQTKLTDVTTEYNTAVTDYNTLNNQLPASKSAYLAAMDTAGQESLKDYGPKNGLSVTLSESGVFWYGPGGVTVGDKIPFNIGSGTVITDTLREAKLTLVSPTHAEVEPVVGERTDQPDRQVGIALNALARAQRNQKASR